MVSCVHKRGLTWKKGVSLACLGLESWGERGGYFRGRSDLSNEGKVAKRRCCFPREGRAAWGGGTVKPSQKREVRTKGVCKSFFFESTLNLKF